jgi:hypothetical protein
MNLRTRIAGGATALAMVGIFGLTAAIPAGAATPSAQTAAVDAAPGLPVTGTLAGAPFVGQLTNLTTSAVNGALRLSGTITGTGIPAMGTPFTTTIVPAAAAADCQVVDLNLQPLNLDLLGLVVDLSAVNLDVTGDAGPGKLLGNLVCGVAGALDPSGLLAGAVSGLLNQILVVLGLGPVAPVV